MTTLSYLPSEDGFLGLPFADAYDAEQARVVVVPFGLEATVSYGGGTSAGPEAILTASQQLELFDEEFWCEPCRQFGIATLSPPDISRTVPDALQQVEGLVGTILSEGRFPLVLGGEHGLTAGTIRPFADRFKDLVVLQIDAHADLRDGYEGEHFSHASAMRRVLDFDHVSLVSVGIRSISSGEIPFYESQKSRIFVHWAKDKRAWDLDEIVKPLKGKPIYVTFDVDGFDSSLMPSTGTPEPGGLFFDEALDLLRVAAKAGRIVGADIVELAPVPGQHAPDFLTAKLAYKLMSYAMLSNR